MTLESAPGPLRSLAALTATPCALREVEGDIATAGVETLREHRVGWRRV